MKTVLKIIVTLVLLFLAARMIDVTDFRDILARANLPLFCVSLPVLVVGGFAGSFSWWFVLRTKRDSFSYKKCVLTYWSGMFFNAFLPSNIGGDVFKGCVLAREEHDSGFVVLSLVIDRAINFGVLACIGIFAFFLSCGRVSAAVIFAVGVCAMIALFVVFARRAKTDSGTCGRFARLWRLSLKFAASPKLFFPALLAALVSQTAKIAQNMFVIAALGLTMPMAYVWFVIPFFGIVSALPISVGGLGVREYCAQYIAVPLGIDKEEIFALSLAGHLAVVLVDLLGVVPFLLHKSGESGDTAA